MVVWCLCEWILNLYFSVLVMMWVLCLGEVDGVDYYFIDFICFQQFIDQGELLEWVEIYGGLYWLGILVQLVWVVVVIGVLVFIEVDLVGVRVIKKMMFEVVIVFLVLFSWQDFQVRLIGCGIEIVDVI